MKNMTGRQRRAQAGLTYIESLLGVVLLSVCLVPIVQAIADNAARRTMLQSSEQDLGCLLRTKERVFAEPFTDLLAAAVSLHTAGTFSNPTSYSEAPTASCPQQRNVYILRYNPTLADPFATTLDEMLYVRIEQAGGSSIATLAIPQ